MLADLEKLIRIPMEPEPQLESFSSLFLILFADLQKINRIPMEPKHPLVINFSLYIFGKNFRSSEKGVISIV